MQVVPVVDGNVIRVLCRLRAISLNPKASTTVKLFWSVNCLHSTRHADSSTVLSTAKC